MSEWKCLSCGKVSALSTKVNNVARSCLACGGLGTLQGIKKSIMNDRPKDRVGKFIPHLLCGSIIEAITRVREYGVKKYSGENGWKQQTMLDYMDAIGRHYSACLNDPTSRDSESGLLHISHIATDAMFVIQFLVDGGVDISTMKEPPKL